ncbi:TPA: hypothetical protein DCL30_04570 [Candidatus Peribacteria bacterium]|nr:MAG: hypothetical protein A3J91_00665 [Candidatus Peribacteria bacterium RIFOXYC2_FULL_58_10]OGJ84049.1 MAG: hypothetical protein A2529_04625 [Candidatus Peribacteria bacterium RIFOXYD2_FULL_58_15]HAI98779.1 hypothetical protein [Candidatus Peribacteria bacterium]HAS34101.1 hypothetical protein [Candidatus Peribacteria bacterium]
MSSRTFSAGLLAATLLLAPLIASAAMLAQPELTTEQREQLLRTCRNVDYTDQIRCEERQLMHVRTSWGLAKPTETYAVYDRLDIGGTKLRKRLQEQRYKENQRYWEVNRRTFGEFKPVTDINTERLPYVNDIRAQRLHCMRDVEPGRPRARCLKAITTEAQEKMRMNRESMVGRKG